VQDPLHRVDVRAGVQLTEQVAGATLDPVGQPAFAQEPVGLLYDVGRIEKDAASVGPVFKDGRKHVPDPTCHIADDTTPRPRIGPHHVGETELGDLTHRIRKAGSHLWLSIEVLPQRLAKRLLISRGLSAVAQLGVEAVLDSVMASEAETRERCKRGRTFQALDGSGERTTSPEWEYEWYRKRLRPVHELLSLDNGAAIDQ
jgi:hypothetical protein